jgi:high affinity Mn2+ porin
MRHAQNLALLALIPALVLIPALTAGPAAWAARGTAPSPIEPEETWNAHVQSTYVWQSKRRFGAAYSGPNSLSTQQERTYSFTASAALGWRPREGTELYLNPEAAQGVPLSGLTGLGGFTNGELARTSGPNLTSYGARLFLRQTFAETGEKEKVESEANQLGGMQAPRRVVLTVGRISLLDIFDDNAYSHDPRTQFMNWALMTHGAFDYAADSRGYSAGLALEWYRGDWVLRAGRFAQPREPNQLALDTAIFRRYGDQIEIEHAHTLAGRPGKVRLLAFRNRARMSRYEDALDFASRNGGTPDLNAVRAGERVKRGVGINVEQSLNRNVGVFARASWADGKTETYAFTEIDRSVSAGVSLNGAAWSRGADTLGLAFVRNGLSKPHRDYLAAGGLGFFIGDGRINYRPETIVEAFYSWGVAKHAWLSLDWQHIRNPAYNADRGPLNVAGVRLHTEF